MQCAIDFTGYGHINEIGYVAMHLVLTKFHLYIGRRQNGQEKFVPANYVKETAPAKIKKVTTKKEVVNVPVKVKRKRTEKRHVLLFSEFILHLDPLYKVD